MGGTASVPQVGGAGATASSSSSHAAGTRVDAFVGCAGSIGAVGARERAALVTLVVPVVGGAPKPREALHPATIVIAASIIPTPADAMSFISGT